MNRRGFLKGLAGVAAVAAVPVAASAGVPRPARKPRLLRKEITLTGYHTEHIVVRYGEVYTVEGYCFCEKGITVLKGGTLNLGRHGVHDVPGTDAHVLLVAEKPIEVKGGCLNVYGTKHPKTPLPYNTGGHVMGVDFTVPARGDFSFNMGNASIAGNRKRMAAIGGSTIEKYELLNGLARWRTV